jgi:hypothetical protein
VVSSSISIGSFLISMVYSSKSSFISSTRAGVDRAVGVFIFGRFSFISSAIDDVSTRDDVYNAGWFIL